MSNDAHIVRLARLRIIDASRQLEFQLANRQGGAPTVEIIRRLRERAANAMAALIDVNFCDPSELPKAITLQNDVKAYAEFLSTIEEIIAEGRQADEETTEDEREELLEVILAQPDGERQAAAMGLIDDERALPGRDG